MILLWEFVALLVSCILCKKGIILSITGNKHSMRGFSDNIFKYVRGSSIKDTDQTCLLSTRSSIDFGLSFCEVLTSKPNIRCYCLSDIHADSEKNQIWVRNTCAAFKKDDSFFSVMVVPGDIGTEVDRILSVLATLVAHFDAVCYVPGNHEAWRQGTRVGGSALNAANRSATTNRMAADSIVKLKEVLQVAVSLGVFIGPVRFACRNNAAALPIDGDSLAENLPSVLIFPLYSWYHSGWDTEPALTNPVSLRMERAIPFQSRWGDFNFCSWPKEIVSSDEDVTDLAANSMSLARAFAALNEPFLPAAAKASLRNDDLSVETYSASVKGEELDAKERETSTAPIKQTPQSSPQLSETAVNRECETVISFSHFVPRTELCPEKRFLLDPKLSAVIGSDPLEQQIRRLQPHLHLFGHTHIPIDLTLDGITYIQWPLGYYRESDKQCSIVYNNDPLLVFDSSLGLGQAGIPSDRLSLRSHWTQYYLKNKRDPSNTHDLPPWVLHYLDKYSGLVTSILERT